MQSAGMRRESFQKTRADKEYQTFVLNDGTNKDQLLEELEMLRIKVAEQEVQIRKLLTRSDSNVEASKNDIQHSTKPMNSTSKSSDSFGVDVLSPLRDVSTRRNAQKRERYSLDGQSRFAASEEDVNRILTPQRTNLERFEKSAQVLIADNDLSILLSGDDSTRKSRSLKQKKNSEKKRGHQRASTLSADIFKDLNHSLDLPSFDPSCSTINREPSLLKTHKTISSIKSFDQFMLLSVSIERLQDSSQKDFLHKVRYLTHEDTASFGGYFCISEADSVDHYPVGSIQRLSSWIHQTDLSRFCFPNGVDFHLINKNMLKSFHDKMPDRYHLLACTDDKGNMRQGLAITIYEEIPTNLAVRFIPKLYELKLQSCAASIIIRWWKKMFIPKDESVMAQFRKSRFMQRISKHNSNKIESDYIDNMKVSTDSNSDYKAHPILRSPFVSNKNPLEISELYSDRVDTGKKKLNFRSPFMSPGTTKLAFNLRTSHTPRKASAHEDLSNADSANIPDITLSRISVEHANKLFDNISHKKLVADFEQETASSITSKIQSNPTLTLQRHKELATTAFEHMLREEICLIPKCYVLIGGKASESILHFAALQRLVNQDRMSKKSQTNLENMQGSKLPQNLFPASIQRRRTYSDNEILIDNAGDIFLDEEKKAKRHEVLHVIETTLALPIEATSIEYPLCDFDFVNRSRNFFEISLPVDPVHSRLSFALPLPQLGSDWGLASILRNLNPVDIQKIINIILLERSIIVIGKNSIDVSASIFALIELLKPFQWAGTVIPILPTSLFEILSSPVPYLVGVAGDSANTILTDNRITQAMEDGLSLVNLDEGFVAATPENSISDILLHTCPSLIDALTSLKSRLFSLLSNQSSGLISFEAFISHGLSTSEALTLRSVRSKIMSYNSNLASDLVTVKDGYKKYGNFNILTNEFDFFPKAFIQQRRSKLALQEGLVHTQLFVTFVSNQRNKDIEFDRSTRERSRKQIAEWVSRQWLIKQNKKAGPQ